MTNERGIVEAAVYSSGRAVSVEEIAQTTGLEPSKVKGFLKELEAEYTSRGSAIEVAPMGEKWTMQIRMEFTDRAQAFAPPEISRDLLKTVALIAYHQPILQSELANMIGSKVYEHVQALEAVNLIARKPSGRSFELATTRYFPEFFGLKETSRDGIRRVLAEKAGVRFTPRLGKEPAEPEPKTQGSTPPPEAASAPATTRDPDAVSGEAITSK